MKKKLSARQIVLLLCLINVAIFSLSYQFIYIKFEKFAETMNLQTELTKQQIVQREQELSKEEATKLQTEELNMQIEEIINTYPVNITKEDNLIFIEDLENALRIDIPYVSVAENVDFYTTILPIRDETGEEIISATPVVQSVTEATTTETLPEDEAALSAETSATIASPTESATQETAAEASGQQYMTGLQCSININFQTTYDGFKKLVDYLEQYPEKTSISDTSLSYDASTGSLMAVLTVNRYALTGTGKVYEKPYIGDISIGKDNIFGTEKQTNTQEQNTVQENTTE